MNKLSEEALREKRSRIKIERTKAWQKLHPERCKKSMDAWRLANPEKVLQASAKWRKNNSEKVWQYKKSWNARHPEKSANLFKEWVKNNRDKMREYKRNHRTALHAFLTKIKQESLCQRCFLSDHRVFDFAHIIPKKDSPSIYAISSWKTLFKELTKVFVLCKNCHWIYDYEAKQMQYKKLGLARRIQ